MVANLSCDSPPGIQLFDLLNILVSIPYLLSSSHILDGNLGN